MPTVGLTFSPLNTPQPGQGGQGPGASPLQDAIKLLSFQLPSVVGAWAGSGVLGPPTAAGGLGALQGNGSMNQFLMQLLRGVLQGQPGELQGPPGIAPTPRVQFFGGPGQPGTGTSASPTLSASPPSQATPFSGGGLNQDVRLGAFSQ